MKFTITSIVILTSFFYLLNSQQSCESDEQCNQLSICHAENKQCIRKSLFPISELAPREILGSIIIFSFIGFAQAAGVGGGVIVTPLLIQLYLYTTKQAVSLVFIVIFCGSIGNLLVLLPQKMSNGVPLIDYDVALISLPTASAGAIFGVILNRFLPDFLVISVLLYLLVTNIKKAYIKQKDLYIKEINKAQAKLQQKELQTILLQDQQQQQLTVFSLSEQSNKQEISNKQYPLDLIFKMIVVMFVTLFISMCRGGSGIDSIIGIPKCGKMYWLFNGLILVSSLILLQVIYSQMIQREQNLKISKQVYITNCKSKDAAEYAKISFWASLIGSFVGVGGGLILIPKWLELGVRAQQASANTIIIITYNSFIAFFQFVIAGTYSLDQVIYFGFMSMLGSFVLAMIIKKLISEDKKDRLLQQILLGVMILSLCLLLSSTISKLFENSNELLSFGKIC